MILKKILLIEDDKSHALLIKRILERHAEEVLHAATLQDASSVLDKVLDIDCVVTDLNLPDADPGRITKFIGEEVKGKPALVLTSSTSVQDAVRAMKGGAKDFIVKEFGKDFDELLSFSIQRLTAQLLLERERELLQKEAEALRSAIENSSDGLCLLSGTGAVISCNSSFLQFVKKCQGRAESVGELFGGFVQSRETLLDNLIKKLDDLSPMGAWTTQINFTNDKESAYELTLSRLAFEERRFIVWTRNISELKRREKFQKEILSTTTHDLKGPLGAILLSSEVLQEQELQPRMKELVVRISSSAHQAVTLIDEFLSAHRIQEGAFILKPSNHEVSSLIHEVLNDYRPEIMSKKLDLQARLHNASHEWSVDKLSFKRILGNLLSNAIKFSEKGGVITVSSEVTNEWLTLSVSDSGTGMEPSEVREIFNRFSRLDRHASYGGTGIGLFIVKSLTHAHGGHVEVTSKVGEGTTFSVSFPKEPPVNGRGELIALDFA